MNGTIENQNKNIGSGDDKNKGNLQRAHCLSKYDYDQSFQRCTLRENENDITVYRSNYHANKVFDNLHEILKTGTLNDIILVTEDGWEVPAHKIILMASSPYFSAMFGNFEERNKDRVVLNGIDHAILQLLVKFVYSTEIHINERNVQPLLVAANLLQLTVVVNVCCDFLLRHLHPSNVFGIHALADQHDCHELVAQAAGYIGLHFTDVVKEEEFVALSSEQLLKFISHDYLVVPSEQSLFDSVISWINYDVNKRKQYLAQLIAQVRLPLMPPKYLMEVVGEEPLIKSNAQATNYFIEALKYHLLKLTNVSLFETPRTKSRKSRELPKLLVVAGGTSHKALRSVECYDFQKEKWDELSKCPRDFRNGGLAALNGRIYIVGGADLHGKSLNTVNVYDLSTDQWVPCIEMLIKRRNFGVVTLDNLIYAIGGRNDKGTLNSAEVYNPTTDRWQLIATMHSTRENFAVSALNGCIYVAGGYDSDSRNFLSSIECYDPVMDQWTSLRVMRTRRTNARADSINGILYITGGARDNLTLASVEAFDPKTNEVLHIKDMPEARANMGVVALHGELYVIGGCDLTTNITSTYKYSPEHDIWSHSLSLMNIERSETNIVVIDKPHNYI